MKRPSTKILAKVAPLALLAGLIPAGLVVLQAHASGCTTTACWEPDANSVGYGTVALYDSSGTQITSGTDWTHLAAYAAASSTKGLTSGKAELDFAAPDHTQADSNGWFAQKKSGSSTWPVTAASAPASIKALSGPVVTLSGTDANLSAFVGAATPDTSAGYNNIYQLRVVQTDTSTNSKDTGGFWTADVQVDPSTGHWTQVYPTAGSSPSPSATASASPSASPSVSPSASPSAGPSASPSASASPHPSASPSASPSPSPSVSPSASPSLPTGGGQKPTGSASLSTGTHRVGAPDTCNFSIDGADSDPSISWAANGVGISGAHDDTYTINEKYYGQTLTCIVVATNSAGSTTITSNGAKIGPGARLKPVGGQGLSGSHRVGDLETCEHGGWTPLYTGFHFQWYVGGSKFGSNGTNNQLRITSAMLGKTLQCVIVAHRTSAWQDGRYVTSKVTVTS